MPDLQQTARSIADYLEQCGLEPPLREISLDPVRRPAAYPHLRIVPEEESSLADKGTNQSVFTLSLACSAGRLEEALAGAMQLAHAVRLKLKHSHGLGGLLGALYVQAVRQSDQDAGDAGCVAWAELDVEVFFTG